MWGQVDPRIAGEPSVGHWLSGVVDSRGRFEIRPMIRGRYACSAVVGFDGDLVAAQRFHQIIGFGETHEAGVWMVARQEDCARLCGWLAAYPPRLKTRDFMVWADGVQHWLSMAADAPAEMRAAKWRLENGTGPGRDTEYLLRETWPEHYQNYAKRALRRACGMERYLALLPEVGHEQAGQIACAEFGHDFVMRTCDRCGEARGIGA